MNLILSPKDNLNKLTLERVKTFALEGETLLVVFEDGRTRNYPLVHLWYYESHVDNHKSYRGDLDISGPANDLLARPEDPIKTKYSMYSVDKEGKTENTCCGGSCGCKTIPE